MCAICCTLDFRGLGLRVVGRQTSLQSCGRGSLTLLTLFDIDLLTFRDEHDGCGQSQPDTRRGRVQGDVMVCHLAIWLVHLLLFDSILKSRTGRQIRVLTRRVVRATVPECELKTVTIRITSRSGLLGGTWDPSMRFH